MADKHECIACMKAQAAKHKKDKGWKIAAVVSSIIAILFIALYFGSGTVVETTEIENEVTVENIGGGDPTNSNIGNISAGNSETTGLYIVIAVLGVLVVLGGVCGYIVAKKGYQKQGCGAERTESGVHDENDRSR